MSIKSNILIAVVAATAMSAGFWLSSYQSDTIRESADKAKQDALEEARKNFSPIQGTVLSPARKISIPALTKDDGSVFTQADITGDWHLFFFGYTHCPDICPVTMGVVSQAKKIALKNNHIFPDVIFVSVDPDRDKVEMLADYVQYFDKDFTGVTGDKNLIKALTLQMSVVYMQMEAEEGRTDYLVDHSSSLLLLNPEGKLVAFMKPPHDAKTILKDFQTIVNLSN